MDFSLSSSLVGSAVLNPDKPSLDLQFAADKTLTARKGPTPVFTRASAATEIGPDGLIRYAPENLVLNSQNFGNNSWIPFLNAAKIRPSTVIDPSGGTSAYEINVGTGGATVYHQYPIVFPAARCTYSVWVRSVSGTSDFRLRNYSGTVSTPSSTFTATTTWTRFQFAFTDTIYQFQIGAASANTVGNILVWGAQAERSETARDYIPTTTAAVYGPRFDHDPITLACKGLLIEESRTNLVFPSETLATQTRTVTAVAHTLSFYGTGTVVLSGVAIATITGTGSYPTRTTLTFTPTAGSLILTVTGSVTQAQLEAGSFATSYIPTVASSVVRSADVCSITGSAFTGFYNQPEGTLFADVTPTTVNQLSSVFTVNTITSNNQHGIYKVNAAFSAAGLRWGSTTVISGAIAEAAIATSTDVATSRSKLSYSYKLNDFAFFYAGTIVGTDTSGVLPSPTTMHIGNRDGSLQINGHLASIRYFRKRLPNAKLQALTV